MRLLRIMRPLRSIRRFPGLRLVVNTVLSAIPAVSYVCFISLVSMSIFATGHGTLHGQILVVQSRRRREHLHDASFM